MTTPRLRSGAAILLAAPVLAAVAAAPAPAAAASTKPSFSLTQSAGVSGIHLKGTRGAELTGSVTVTNLSNRAVTVLLRRADIENAANGNADYVTDSVSQDGAWLELEATTVRLPAATSRTVAFAVTVPRNAGGGSHYAGIVGVDKADQTVTPAQKKANKRKGFVFTRINRQAIPLTIRLPGALKRALRLHSTKLIVQPAGAALALNLLPGGTVLTDSARVRLRITRDSRTVFTHDSTLGQLFPGDRFNYRVAWKGRPSAGSYRVVGSISPVRGKVVRIDETVRFTPTAAKKLKRVTPELVSASGGTPIWVWPALGLAGALLIGLSLAVVKLAHRPPALPAG